jgi:hypothetical protein
VDTCLALSVSHFILSQLPYSEKESYAFKYNLEVLSSWWNETESTDCNARFVFVFSQKYQFYITLLSFRINPPRISWTIRKLIKRLTDVTGDTEHYGGNDSFKNFWQERVKCTQFSVDRCFPCGLLSFCVHRKYSVYFTFWTSFLRPKEKLSNTVPAFWCEADAALLMYIAHSWDARIVNTGCICIRMWQNCWWFPILCA